MIYLCQCRRNSGCFPPGKTSSQGTALPSFFFLSPCVQCFRVSIPPGCEAYSFRTDGYGTFNVRAKLGACRTHEGEPGTKKSAKELTRKGGGAEKLFLSQEGIEPRVIGFEFRLSNHWARKSMGCRNQYPPAFLRLDCQIEHIPRKAWDIEGWCFETGLSNRSHIDKGVRQLRVMFWDWIVKSITHIQKGVRHWRVMFWDMIIKSITYL